MMKKRMLSRNGHISKTAVDMLRSDPGSITRIAERSGVHKSTVSRVARGLQKNLLVQAAIIRECRRMAKSRGVAATAAILAALEAD